MLQNCLKQKEKSYYIRIAWRNLLQQYDYFTWRWVRRTSKALIFHFECPSPLSLYILKTIPASESERERVRTFCNLALQQMSKTKNHEILLLILFLQKRCYFNKKFSNSGIVHANFLTKKPSSAMLQLEAGSIGESELKFSFERSDKQVIKRYTFLWIVSSLFIAGTALRY